MTNAFRLETSSGDVMVLDKHASSFVLLISQPYDGWNIEPYDRPRSMAAAELNIDELRRFRDHLNGLLEEGGG